MEAFFTKNGRSFRANLSQGIDISLGIGTPGPRAWYVADPIIEPVRSGSFVGSVAEGSSVNFFNIHFNPHGHGTHTECVGHVSRERIGIDERLNRYFFWATLVSIHPTQITQADGRGAEAGDWVITAEQLRAATGGGSVNEALVIRTWGSADKRTHQYSNTNPPYLSPEVGEWLNDQGVQHLLIDLPSVDREQDGGKLSVHHRFWSTNENYLSTKTITELICVPATLPDGEYLLNLQVSSFQNDAAPSRPVLHPIEPV